MSRVTFLLLVLIVTLSVQAAEKVNVPPFPIVDSVPGVEEWKVIKEEMDSRKLFVERYHLAPAENQSAGPLGFTLTIKNIPDFGIIYQAWGIKLGEDGRYDFSSAVFAFKLENQWYEVRPGFIPRVVFTTPSDSVTVYENEKVVVYRRVVGREFDGREKFSARVVRQLWWEKRRESRIRVKSIYLIIERPHGEKRNPLEEWIHEFKLPQPKIIEKTERLN